VLNLLSFHQPHPWEGQTGRGPSRPAAAGAAAAGAAAGAGQTL